MYLAKTMSHNQQGFTLIETLIYLGLFTIIMVGVVAVAYSTFEANGRLQTKTLIQEEGDFLLAKLNWALTGATAATVVSLPSLPSLTLTRANNPTQVVFDKNGNFLEIKRNGSPTGDNLNNSDVQITNLNFIPTGGGTSVESITAGFSLQTKTPNGQTYSQDFQTTKYLRK